MGILNDIAMGKADFVNGDVENLSDPRKWPIPQKAETHSEFTKEEKKTTDEEDVESDSSNGEDE